jgi:dihydropteroate synthase
LILLIVGAKIYAIIRHIFIAKTARRVHKEIHRRILPATQRAFMNMTINCKGKLLPLDEPVVMGIINITPDSFYSGSRQQTVDEALMQAAKMVGEGAVILDIGGQSTRPGSEQAGAEAEAARVLPVIEMISKQFPNVVISVDTFYSTVAEEAVHAGAHIINDISGGTLDAAMIPTAGRLKVPYICMHMKGTPATMQQHAVYGDVTKEVLEFFIHRIQLAKEAGINDIIVDPGFGFAKTHAHNFTLLRNLRLFEILDKPILAGISRKSTIYKTLGVTAEEALNGTTVLNTIALLNGAHILRVHDVKEAREAVKLAGAYKGSR